MKPITEAKRSSLNGSGLFFPAKRGKTSFICSAIFMIGKHLFIIQRKFKDYETIYVFGDGRVICDTCVNGIWNKDRDYCSYCVHAKTCIEDITNGDLSKWEEVG